MSCKRRIAVGDAAVTRPAKLLHFLQELGESMTPRKLVFALVAMLAGAVNLGASGPLGIYGIVEKVVFEPNEQSPERAQVWGAFAYVESSVAGQSLTVSTAKKGYLYFRVLGVDEGGNEQATRLVRNEWADLKSVAGTGQAVGFGRWGYIGGFGGLQPDTFSQKPPLILEAALRNQTTDLRVRPAAEPPARPALYQTDSGVVKLSASGSHAAIVQKLRDALR